MKKLRIKSPLRISILLLFLVAIVYISFSLTEKPVSNFGLDTKMVTGTITNCKTKTNGYQLTVNDTLVMEKILVNYYEEFECRVGLKIKAIGEIKEPSSRTIFNLFDYQKYLLSQKINYTFTADKIMILGEDDSIFYQLKNSLQDHINSYQSKDYLNSFVLGNSDFVSEEAMNSYQVNGISHLLAISGLNITIIAGIILFILNKVNKREKINYTIVILALMFYMFLTNFTPSVVRATLMFIILTFTKMFNLKIETMYILLLVLSVYLLYNPYMVYHIGFLLSFVTTFYLILFSDLIQNTKGYLYQTFIISLIAFLASMPILINNFFTINLLSPFINIIFVPLVSLFIYPLSLITLVVKPLDGLFYTLVTLMEDLSLIISEAGLNLVLKHVDIILLILYYVLITYALYKLVKKQKRGLVLVLITLTIHANINYLSSENTLTMIDVGQGDSILLKLKHNMGNILIDTGGQMSYDGSEPYDLATNKLIPYLRSEGISKLDYLVLTHGDFDHAGMTLNLLKNFKVDNIILNKENDNDLEKQVIKYAQKQKIKHYHFQKEILKVGNVKFYFLNDYKTADENENSLIIYTKIEKQNILLMGDAGEKSENYLINNYDLPEVDILKVGHHGSRTSSSKAFIDEIKPKYSLISAEKNNRYGHPHKKTLQNLNDSIIYRTDKDGSIKFILKKNRLKIQTCLQ